MLLFHLLFKNDLSFTNCLLCRRQTKTKVAQVTTEEGSESSVKKQSLETSR